MKRDTVRLVFALLLIGCVAGPTFAQNSPTPVTTDAERIKLLQRQNDDLQRRVLELEASVTKFGVSNAPGPGYQLPPKTPGPTDADRATFLHQWFDYRQERIYALQSQLDFLTDRLTAPGTYRFKPQARPKPKMLLVTNVDKETLVLSNEARNFGFEVSCVHSFSQDPVYTGCAVVVVGSNAMDFWTSKTVGKWLSVDRYVRGGGHLVVFGDTDGRGTEVLTLYGIYEKAGQYRHFAPSPIAGSAFVKGNEQQLPPSGVMRSVCTLNCALPSAVHLLDRVTDQGTINGPAFLTIPVGHGRVSVTCVEPYLDAGNVSPESMWLIPVTMSWLARDCPIK